MVSRRAPVKLGVLWKLVEGKLVVRCERVPPLGERVYDSGLREVGVVSAVFGPVSQPFAEVRLTRSRDFHPGEIFYTLGGRRR